MNPDVEHIYDAIDRRHDQASRTLGERNRTISETFRRMDELRQETRELIDQTAATVAARVPSLGADWDATAGEIDRLIAQSDWRRRRPPASRLAGRTMVAAVVSLDARRAARLDTMMHR